MDIPYDPSLVNVLNHPAQTHMAILQSFWQGQLHAIEQGELDFKTFQLPLARIKKVMKTDEDVKMISAEAPIIFAKACEIFVLELTLRAWIHTEENKRRTLQRNDVAAAVAKTDTFDFLIDIVPREESRSVTKKLEHDFHLGAIDPSTTGYYYTTGGTTTGAIPSTTAYQSQVIDPRTAGGMNSLLYYQQQQQMQHLQYLRQQHMMGGSIQDTSGMMSSNQVGTNTGTMDYSQGVNYINTGENMISQEQYHIQ